MQLIVIYQVLRMSSHYDKTMEFYYARGEAQEKFNADPTLENLDLLIKIEEEYRQFINKKGNPERVRHGR